MLHRAYKRDCRRTLAFKQGVCATHTPWKHSQKGSSAHTFAEMICPDGIGGSRRSGRVILEQKQEPPKELLLLGGR